MRLHYVQVKQPDMHDPSGDLRRLFEALEAEWSLKDLTCDLSVLQMLQPTLRAGAWQVTVAVHAAKQIIGVWPGLHETAFGLAVDIGSTTIAAHLCDLLSGEVVASAGVMNPQIRFGEDLMSRVSYSMMNPGGAAQMTAAVREALCGLALDVATQRRAFRTRTSSRRRWSAIPSCITCCSASIRWSSAARRSRSPSITRSPCGRTSSISSCIATHESTCCRASPVTSARMPRAWCSPSVRISREEMTLLVDVGTNAEIVLGNRRASGRLLEPDRSRLRRRADQLRSARRAGSDRARAHRPRDARAALQSHRLRSVVRRSRASRQATAATGITGVCGSGIIEVIAEMYLAGIINQDGVLDGRLAARSPRIVANGRTFAYLLHRGAAGTNAVEMKITQNDVRAIQLAKAALVRRHRAADGAARHRSRRSHPARRRVRQPHRRQVRDDPRHDSGLRS